MVRAFTTKSVEAIKPDPKVRAEHADPAFPALYLVVQPSGVKSWAVRYRFAGKPAKLTLGRWPLMGLKGAREAASSALQEVELGLNPAAAKKAAKAALIDAEQSQRDKVKTSVEQFNRRHLKSLKSGEQGYNFLRRFVVESWGDRDVQTITKRDAIDLLDKIVDSGRATTANRVLAHSRKFFNWMVERDVIATSPFAGVKAPAKETSRDRVLTDPEIRFFWQACDRVGEPWGPFVKLLLLTGQRLNEVAQMTDSEVGGEAWVLGAERTKNGRAHEVALSGPAQAVLGGVSRIGRAGRGPGYIFTTTGRTPVSGFHRARAQIAEAMQAIANEQRPEGAPEVEIAHWGFHDLRRTAATGMARLGVAVRVTEAVLNHVSGTGGGIVAVHQRHDYGPEKRAALDAWASFVMRTVDGPAGNVVLLRKAGERAL